MPAIPLRETLSGTLENLLLFSVFFVALPHAFNLSPYVFLFFAAMLGWRYATGLRPALKPNQAMLFLLMLAGAALVYFQYHRVYGRDGGSALFLVGLGLKLMEMKTRREVYLVVYLSFFVALTQYLFSETIPMVLYTLAAVGLTVAVLIGANSGTAIPLSQLLKRAGAMVAQAVPIMVVLFVFFPRIPGPLWKMPDDGSVPKTGLSDIMEPGSVSRLSGSSEPAFRVDFEGEPPPPALRYWRGPTFWRTNGVRWSAAPELPARHPLRPELAGPAYRYAITIEPHQRRWVFALDLPARVPEDLEQTMDFLLLSKDKLNERRQYALVSQPYFRTGPLSPDEEQRGLQLPGKPAPRASALVESWRADAATPRALVDRALKYFRAENFYYTLSPPALPDNPIERFLFETRKGFCEHYATAFVYLMRVAGVPARIVTGYQGGQWNPVGKFLEVRQADAHAWAEVWLPDGGWTRVDPTAAVAPERIEQGIDLDSQSAAGEVRFNVESDALGDGAFGLRAWLQEGRLLWSSVDHAWNQWVLAYSPENQRHFWEALGIVDWRGLLAWLGGLMALCGMAAAWLFWPRRRVAADPAVKAYRRFLKKLARRGTVKRIGEGPLDFAKRAAAEQPQLQADIHRITGTFLRVQYGKEPEPADLARLKQMVGEFRV
ncbi:transglutaminase TgpA family protein [Methylomagnum sp.]